MIVKQLCLAILLVAVLTTAAQKKELTNNQYFKNDFSGITQPLPNFSEWLTNETFIYTKEGKKYAYNCKSNISTEYATPVVNKGKTDALPIIINKDNNLYWRKSEADVQLTLDKDKEQNPIVSPDGNYVAYTKNNNLYSFNLMSKEETQLTNDGSETLLNGYLSWVYMEEIIGRQSRYKGFWWSPDSKKIAFFQSDEAAVPIFTITDADGQHGLVEQQRYPKVGDKNPTVKIGIATVDGSNTTWADFNPKTDQYFGQPNWTPDGKQLWVNWMNRGNDHLIVYAVDPSNGSKKTIYEEKQKTWIDLDDNDRIQFLESGKGFLLLSDRTGWKHIYLYDMNGKLVNPITQGNYTVLSIERIDEKTSTIYFVARSKENTARRDLYSVKMNGKDLKRLTFGDFTHQANISPDGKYIYTIHSNSTTPTATSVIDVKKNKVTPFASIKTDEIENYTLAKTELVRVKSDDGKYDLPLKITWPTNYDKSKKYPVLISIYGGPDAGTVWDTWVLNGTQQWYAKEGLIQVAMDHRASGHFGKEGVSLMHRNLGYWEMVDYTTMVKWLIANANADAKKICITGFSYGGYVSCYALTHSADVFTHGMAGGSVIDWSLYDSHYTEKLMDTPNENVEGYKKANVLTYVSQYKGVLQMVHGVIDDNVHLQNSIQLLTKLQDLKKDVEFMPYSGGRHGWRNLPARNAHYENLKIKFIYKYLLEKEVSNAFLK